MLAGENDRRSQKEAICVVLVSYQNHVFFYQVRQPRFERVWNCDVFLCSTHCNSIDDVVVAEGVVIDRRHEKHLAVLELDEVLLPVCLSGEAHVYVA